MRVIFGGLKNLEALFFLVNWKFALFFGVAEKRTNRITS